MITPQQRNAWREKYLEEMCKVSQESFPIGDLQGFMDENILEDRIFLSFMDTLIPFINTIGYYLQNNPLSDDPSDLADIPEENRFSLPDLFEYLTGMSQYGCEIVLSKVPDFEEPLFSAIQDNDKERFLSIITENEIDLSEICLEVGNANAFWWYLHDVLSSFIDLLQSALDDDIEEEVLKEKLTALEEKNNEFLEHSPAAAAGAKMAVEKDADFHMLIKKISSINLPADENTLSLYAGEIMMYYLFIRGVYDFLSTEEKTIFNDALSKNKYNDILNDIKRVVYILFGFSGGELYCLENIEDLDRIREDFSKEIQAACVDPFLMLSSQFVDTTNTPPTKK
jgi:hypothetical protein